MPDCFAKSEKLMEPKEGPELSLAAGDHDISLIVVSA